MSLTTTTETPVGAPDGDRCAAQVEVPLGRYAEAVVRCGYAPHEDDRHAVREVVISGRRTVSVTYEWSS